MPILNGGLLKKNKMCHCINVEIGSYHNQVELKRPSHMIGRKEGSESETICVDKCLSEEIQMLWSLEISTTGCCCGHNKLEPYIGVIDADISKMLEMGYSIRYNTNRPHANDSFIPKTKLL